MIALPLGQCRSCGDPVSYFARRCPSCDAPNQPNPVATIAALGAVVVLGLIGGLTAIGVQAFRGKGTTQAVVRPDATSNSASTPADSAKDYGWIVKAMAECEEEAKQKADTLNFLIIPVIRTAVSLPGWVPNPISDVGASATLLNSGDAMIGLRNGAMVLYQKPMAFAISDAATNTVYKWKQATGVTALKTKDVNAGGFKLGFEIPEIGKEIEWGPVINLDKGNCYWINLLVRPRPKSG
jgi:hypothetical protein